MKPTNALLLGVSLASAQQVYQPTVGRGPIPQDRFNESDLAALSTPNASTSVNFTIGGQEWTWRVNITDLSVPDASIDDKPTPDARIVMTTYDLQRPSTHGVQTPSNVSEIEDPICMSVLDDAIVWPNVTNEYESDSSSSCEPVFGQECLRVILTEQTFSPSSGGGSGGGSITPPNATISNQPHTDSIPYYQYAFPSYQSNTTALRQAESRLRLILITLPNDVKTAVCMRVDPSIDDTEVSEIAQRLGWNGSESGGAESEGSGSSSSGGDESGAGARFAAALGAVGVVGVGAVVFGGL